jgi:hypothetical protein
LEQSVQPLQPSPLHPERSAVHESGHERETDPDPNHPGTGELGAKRSDQPFLLGRPESDVDKVRARSKKRLVHVIDLLRGWTRRDAGRRISNNSKVWQFSAESRCSAFSNPRIATEQIEGAPGSGRSLREEPHEI